MNAAAGVAPIRLAVIRSQVGPLLAGASDSGIRLLEFHDHAALPARIDTLKSRFDGAVEDGAHPLLEGLITQLGEYFARQRREFTVPLDPRGTDFQRRVWDLLLAIPYGETRTYESLARALASPGAIRAVGAANGANPIAIVIPCHRVINTGGGLGGYGGGLARKRTLLDLESGARTLFDSP